MKQRKLFKTLGILFVVALCLITAALAYTVPSDTIVYITPTGSKYHREDCSYITTARGMTIEQAERKGYGPCSRCDPDEKTGVYASSSKSSGSSSKSYATPTPKPTPSPKPEKTVSGGDIARWIAISVFVILPVGSSVIFHLCSVIKIIVERIFRK